MVRGSLSLKGRMLAALLAMVALNAAFVTVVAWSYLVLLPIVVGGGYLYVVDGVAPSLWELVQLPFAPRWLAALTVAFLAGQVYYGYTRVLDDVRTSTVGPDEHPTLHAIVGRLAAAADVPKPAISVVEDGPPNSFTVGRGHAATVVVTASLLELLDETELEGVLAHEIAHVRHRDVTLMTITGLFVAVAERALQHARLLRRGVTDRDRVSARQRLVLTWLLPVVAFTYVFVAPVLWLFPPVARFASGELSRQREFAADRAAAELTGAPTPLARALVAIHEASSRGQRAESDDQAGTGTARTGSDAARTGSGAAWTGSDAARTGSDATRTGSGAVRTDSDVARTDLRREHASLQALCVVPTGAVRASQAVRESASDRERSGRDDGTGCDDVAGRDDADAPGATAVGSGESTADASADADSAASDTGAATTVAAAPGRATPADLDPVEWLGTTQSGEEYSARTHPPIDERVRRLVAVDSRP